MDQTKFSKGEKVLCKWRQVWYEARILEIRHEIDGVQYYHVHYVKFSKKWNETVSEHRIMPHTSENVKIMKLSKKIAYKVARDMRNSKINGTPFIEERNGNDSNNFHNNCNDTFIQDQNLNALSEPSSNTSIVDSMNDESVKDMQKYILKDVVVKIPKVDLPSCDNKWDFCDDKDKGTLQLNNSETIVELKKEGTSTSFNEDTIESFPNIKTEGSSRGAAVKAASAITMMSKSGTKKNKHVRKQTKSNQKFDLDEDDSSDGDDAELKEYGIDFPDHCIKIYIEDYHLLEDDRYILNLPAKITVYMIMCDYARKFPVCLDTLNIMLDAFNQGLGIWCLYRIEKLQYQQVVEKYSQVTVSHIYGLSHLIRFILCLPKLFRLMENDCKEFVPNVRHFIRGLLIYLVDENLCIDVERDYQPVMPDYYRMTYF